MQIKTGISDGITTELVEGLKEGDAVVIGADTTTGHATAIERLSLTRAALDAM